MSITKFLFFVSFIALCLPVYAQTPKTTNQNAQPREDELTRHQTAAESYQLAGDLPNAAIENRAIVAVALKLQANLALREGQVQRAVKLFGDSIEFRDDAETRINLAYAYMRSSETDKAVAEAKNALRVDAKNAQAHYLLGRLFYTKGDYAAALPELEKTIVGAPDFDSAYALGVTYLHLKQIDRAKLLFEEMQGTFKKNNSELHILFGQAFEQTNYPLEAEREFKRALTINPKQARASFFLGYMILQYGGSERLSEAGQAFERELQLAPNDFFTNFFAGVVASSENKHEKAIQYLQKAVQLNPKSGEAYLFLGQSQIESNDLIAAEKNLRRAVELAENDSKAKYQSRRTHFLLGRLLVKTNRREEGERELALAKKIQQESLNSARDEISQILGQVIGETKKTPVENTAQIQANQEVNLPAQTIAELKKIKAYLADALAQAFYNLGVIAFQGNHLPEALEKFAAAAGWKPDFPNLDRNWGIVAFRGGQFDKAIAPLARQIKANPQDNLARQMLGASFYFTKNYKNAVETLKPIEAAITNDAELAYFYAVSLIQLERNQEAKPIFDKLARSSQKNPETLINAAQGFMFLGDYERAVKEFRAVSALAPNTPKTNFFIGQSLMRLNRFDEAKKAFEQELIINPADEAAKYHLALTLVERKIRIDEAIKLLNEAIALRSDYADAHYQLGKIYNERGETEKAIERLEAAANSDAKKDYIHYQLSIAYRKASRKEDADRELKLYQELKSANRKTESLMPMGSNKNAP